MRTAGDTGGLLGRSMPAACHTWDHGLATGRAGPATRGTRDGAGACSCQGPHPRAPVRPGGRFGANYDPDKDLHLVLTNPGLSHLSARQILDRLLGI